MMDGDLPSVTLKTIYRSKRIYVMADRMDRWPKGVSGRWMIDVKHLKASYLEISCMQEIHQTLVLTRWAGAVRH